MRQRFEQSLIVRFSVIGFIVTATAAAAVGFFLQSVLVRGELEEAATLAGSQASAIFGPLLTPADLGTALRPETYAAVDRAARLQLIEDSGAVRIKIWNRDAQLLYCDVPSYLGEREPDNAELAEALAGEVHAGISSLEKEENVSESREYGRLLEVYVPLRLEGTSEVLGAYELYVSTDRLDQRVREIRGGVAGGVFGGFAVLYLALFGVVARASRRLVVQSAENERLAQEVVAAYDQTIQGWAKALELRDKETEGHSWRVTGLTVAVAQELGLPSDSLDDIRRGALLHDIGKMGIPDSILLKPGPLDDAEWEVMRRHPDMAVAALTGIGFIARAVEIPWCHHEKWDGSGYPRGLAGDDIPIGARIFAVVDVWDALSTDRPYREAWPQERVVGHLRSQAGTHFDPDVVDAFLRVLPRKDWLGSR